jgi:polar amino acid transport system substrate-binding protein
MKSIRIMAAVLAFTGLCFASAALAAPKAITVATDATWPPMEFVDANKKIVGFDIDFMNAIAKEAGFQVTFKNTAWDGIFAGVEAGQ